MLDQATDSRASTSPLSEEQIPALRESFALLNRQRIHHASDYLAHPGIVDFHRDRLEQQIRRADTDPTLYWINYDSQPRLVFGIQHSGYHSTHYQVPYYKLNPLFCFTEAEPELTTCLPRLIAAFPAEPDTVITTRIETHQHALAYAMVQQGFVPVGTSIRMVLNPPEPSAAFSDSENAYIPGGVIAPLQPEELAAVQAIGTSSHHHSHFYQEMRFPRETTRTLFAEWIRKCADGLADTVLVARLKDDIVGFCTLLSNSALEPYIGHSIGVVDFIAVSEHAQGKRIGQALLNAALDWFQGRHARIELRTMVDNGKAIRFYERNGFRFLSSDLHLHYWSHPSMTR